jgi:hypothetical protein
VIPDCTSTNVTYSVMSPGHSSDHMLQVDFAGPINRYTSFHLQHLQYNRCLAYNYTISFDYQFTNLDGQPLDNSAALSIDFGYCYSFAKTSTTTIEVQPAAGWRHVTLHCQSHENGPTSLDLIIQTVQTPESIPSFSLQLDNMQARRDP